MPDEELHPELQTELDEALFALDELMSESPDEALAMFQTLPETVRERPEFKLTRARALQQAGQLKEARNICEMLVNRVNEQGLLADVHHLLADVLEDLGDSELANVHFKKTLSIDEALFPERQHIDSEELLEKIGGLIKGVLEEVRGDRAKRVTPRMELFPTPADIEQGLDPRAFTAYVEDDGAGLLRVFCANLDAEYGDLDELDEFDEHVEGELFQQVREQLGI